MLDKYQVLEVVKRRIKAPITSSCTKCPLNFELMHNSVFYNEYKRSRYIKNVSPCACIAIIYMINMCRNKEFNERTLREIKEADSSPECVYLLKYFYNYINCNITKSLMEIE